MSEPFLTQSTNPAPITMHRSFAICKTVYSSEKQPAPSLADLGGSQGFYTDKLMRRRRSCCGASEWGLIPIMRRLAETQPTMPMSRPKTYYYVLTYTLYSVCGEGLPCSGIGLLFEQNCYSLRSLTSRSFQLICSAPPLIIVHLSLSICLSLFHPANNNNNNNNECI